MQVYLIRHAHAEDGDDDAARPLSAKGRRQVRRMAAFLRRGGLMSAGEIWHSPLVRARDTAVLLAGTLGHKIRLIAVAGLEPRAGPGVMARRLANVGKSVALVGHEPHLSALATLLLAGRAEPPLVKMRKGAVAALERDAAVWSLRWLVSPGELE